MKAKTTKEVGNGITGDIAQREGQLQGAGKQEGSQREIVQQQDAPQLPTDERDQGSLEGGEGAEAVTLLKRKKKVGKTGGCQPIDRGTPS